MSITACAADRFGSHDYRQPAHNTPDDPRDAPDVAACQAQSAQPPFGACEHERRYEVVVYQIATHDWIRLFTCVPCTATLRNRHHRLGPGGTEGIARVRDAGRWDDAWMVSGIGPAHDERGVTGG